MLTCRVNPTLHPRPSRVPLAPRPSNFPRLSSASPKVYPLCFDTLPHSFALAFLLKPLESSNSALSAQNTGGGGYPLNSIFIFSIHPLGSFLPACIPFSFKHLQNAIFA